MTPSEKKADNVLMGEWVYMAPQGHECCQPLYSSKTKSLEDTLIVRAPTKVLQKNLSECKSEILNSKVK